MDDYTRQRISFDTSAAIRAGLDTLPHGFRKQLLNILCEQLVAGYQTEGTAFLGKVLSREIMLYDKEAENGHK
jgi:hypothetical protein